MDLSQHCFEVWFRLAALSSLGRLFEVHISKSLQGLLHPILLALESVVISTAGDSDEFSGLKTIGPRVG